MHTNRNNTCAICMQPIETEETMSDIEFHCSHKHLFHYNYIKKWKNSCPICCKRIENHPQEINCDEN